MKYFNLELTCCSATMKFSFTQNLNNMEDSGERSAQEYLAKHKILELFENLTATLVVERPGKYCRSNILLLTSRKNRRTRLFV